MSGPEVRAPEEHDRIVATQHAFVLSFDGVLPNDRRKNNDDPGE
jgi:hypothetical protein